MKQPDIIDKVAMAFSAALMLVGIVGLGIVEIIAGKPYGAAPLTNEAGEVIATPAVDPTLRTGLVILGLLVLAVWGLYRMASTEPAEGDARREVTAD
ncbi:hypothetical protein [Halobaculum gomorrense]|uniref:Uncharacterized protein n=1 Tax=Halobaculum gomorrense TaxID=43928 RepID=A0A1M5SYW5_9EURY|nr:hypothetical protein [Halobaculum gomorrense]SHH43540.1 hypothetical protein SAMN05443636_2574 [Halobaculum gomorrense]